VLLQNASPVLIGVGEVQAVKMAVVVGVTGDQKGEWKENTHSIPGVTSSFSVVVL